MEMQDGEEADQYDKANGFFSQGPGNLQLIPPKVTNRFYKLMKKLLILH